MLERLPRTRAVFDTTYPDNRAVIRRTMDAHKNLIEEIRRSVSPDARGEVFFSAFKKFSGQMAVPVSPSDTIIPFALDAAHAWDETPAEERKRLGLHPTFYENCGCIDFNFFSAKRIVKLEETKWRLGKLIAIAFEKKDELVRMKLLMSLRNGFTSPEDFSRATANSVREVVFLGKGMSYVLHQGSCPAKIILPDMEEHLIHLVEQVDHFLRGIVKRLAVGYSPDL